MTTLDVGELLLLRSHLVSALATVDAALSGHKAMSQLDLEVEQLMQDPKVSGKTSYYLLALIEAHTGAPLTAIRASLQRQGYVRRRNSAGIVWSKARAAGEASSSRVTP